MLLSNYVIMLTLADWSVLIDALIAALMIIYGLWIRDIVKHQEKLKDAAIQALQAALTAKEAEVSRLKDDMAPNIVKAYQEMREHADKMTADVMEMQRKLEKAQATTEPREALSEASGLNLGNRILVEKLGKYMPPNEKLPTLVEIWQSIQDAVMDISEESDIRIEKAQESLDNPKR